MEPHPRRPHLEPRRAEPQARHPAQGGGRCHGHPGRRLNRPPVATCAALGLIACALADLTHEAGHLLAASLLGVQVLSLSSVALQTASASRLVAAAGTLACLAAGTVSLRLFVQRSRLTPAAWCLWLYAVFCLLNVGYLVASALLGNGDWALVLSGLTPAWAWSAALALLGAALYGLGMRAAAQAVEGRISRRALRRLAVAAYLAGGSLLTLAALFNPISPALVWIAGAGASFGLSAGLLFMPGLLATPAPPIGDDGPRSSVAWIAAAMLVGALFVAVLGRGIFFAPP